MARIPIFTEREALPPEQQQFFDAILGSRGGRLAPPFRVLLHNPDVAARAAHLGTALRWESDIPGDLREIAILAITRHWDCQYVFTAHARLAREEGVQEESIRAIAERRAPEGLTEREAAVTSYVQELAEKHKVGAAAFQAAQDVLGTKGLVEVTALVGYYTIMSFTVNAFEMGLDPTMTPMLPE